jgi:hypothetical protein
MAQVICTSKHAKFSKQIGGVKFFNSDAGLISEEITNDQAVEFCKTPTFFRLHEGDPIENVKKAAAKRSSPPSANESGAAAPSPGF